MAHKEILEPNAGHPITITRRRDACGFASTAS